MELKNQNSMFTLEQRPRMNLLYKAKLRVKATHKQLNLCWCCAARGGSTCCNYSDSVEPKLINLALHACGSESKSDDRAHHMFRSYIGGGLA